MLLLAVMLLLPMIRMWFGNRVTGDPRPVTPRGALADFEQTTVELFKETSPSVVFITTKALTRDRFFGIQERESGTGSGFVWDKNGHIVTNFHVIEGASTATVVFDDQSSYSASLVGISPDNDLAVLRISAPADYLRPVLIGESEELLVGQSVFAIGNPFGLKQTLTTGIISAKDRRIQSPSNRQIDNVIQIDAAINPGNSGGPLLDSAGRLIGVNTAIYSPTGTSAGLGFAIPVDTVNEVVPRIIARGDYEPPKLGVYTDDETSESIGRRYGIRGIVVVGVAEGSPAMRAGLEGIKQMRREIVIGDIILSLDGVELRTRSDLQNVLSEKSVGDTVTLEVFRSGDRRTVQLTL